MVIISGSAQWFSGYSVVIIIDVALRMVLIYWCTLSICYSFLPIMLKLSYPQFSFAKTFQVK